jgi:hypothetical protein
MMIRPSGLAIGTLFSYLGTVAVAAVYGAVLVVRMLTGIKAEAAGVSSPLEAGDDSFRGRRRAR